MYRTCQASTCRADHTHVWGVSQGRPKGVTEEFRLTPVLAGLKKYLKCTVTKADDCIGADVRPPPLSHPSCIRHSSSLVFGARSISISTLSAAMPARAHQQCDKQHRCQRDTAARSARWIPERARTGEVSWAERTRVA